MCATSFPDAPNGREPHRWEGQYPTGVTWDANIPLRRIESLLDQAAAQHPDRACMDFLGKRYSYGQIATLVARAAHGFRTLGVGLGVKVAMYFLVTLLTSADNSGRLRALPSSVE